MRLNHFPDLSPIHKDLADAESDEGKEHDIAEDRDVCVPDQYTVFFHHAQTNQNDRDRRDTIREGDERWEGQARPLGKYGQHV